MRPHVILLGQIGCGKSTLIRQALGSDAVRAGGYVTLRMQEGDRLLGFELACAQALADPCAGADARRFLDFTAEKKRDDSVFSDYAVNLLTDALRSPFAVADEFGGVELLVPEFRNALVTLLRSPVPLVGVLKTRRASDALAARMALSDPYREIYARLRHMLEQDENTLLLETTGRGDSHAQEVLDRWVREYVRN